MALRLRIPLLFDVLLVSDPGEITELLDEAALTRPVAGGGHWLHRRVARQLDPGLRFDGELLPVLRPPGRRSPADDRAGLTALWRAQRARRAPLVRMLARHVAGHPIPRPVGVVAQELLGTLFHSDYRSTPQLYRDARRVRAWLGPRGVLGLGRRRLEGAKRRLLNEARGRLDCVHATAIAVHNLLESLGAMRALVADDRLRARLDAAGAAARSLSPPALLLRSAQAAFQPSFRRRPLALGALVALRLRRACRRQPLACSPFATGHWSACPASQLVPELLGEVWEARRREAPVLASRPALYERFCEWIADHLLARFTWHKLPGFLGVVWLIGLRTWMRRERLIDTEAHVAAALPAPGAAELSARGVDGRYNDLDRPEMGAAGRRFGRNLPPPRERHGLLDPNPRELSLALMTRDVFVPAPGLNVLAAAWIQFMVHDWFRHAPDPVLGIEVPPVEDDPWLERPMRVPCTLAAARGPAERPRQPVFANSESHWWDASQLYGSQDEVVDGLRSHQGGRLRMGEGGRLPRASESAPELSGFTENWWIGLSLLHTLFALEHNAICDELARHNPGWSDEALFGRARLVNAALLAKIHTVDWTPAVLDHPALHITMRSTWQGAMPVWLRRASRLFARHDLAGPTPGSRRDHHGVDYALTEEFVAVYRMHQLLPDHFEFRSAADGRLLGSASLKDVAGVGAQQEIDRTSLEDALYSLGLAQAGAITLHNYPVGLQRLEREGQETLDLAAIDILRDRERGIPRFNEFRELVGLPRFRSFEEMSERREWAKELERAYRGDLSKVDLQVGMAVERKPAGFGFGETAFRIFAVMAARRLKSDRFFTTDYTPEIYTPEGLAWVERNDFASVLRRHHPVLGLALQGLANPFAPWRRIGPAR